MTVSRQTGTRSKNKADTSIHRSARRKIVSPRFSAATLPNIRLEERERERARDDPRPRNFRPFFTRCQITRIQQRDSPSDSFARLDAAHSRHPRFIQLFSFFSFFFFSCSHRSSCSRIASLSRNSFSANESSPESLSNLIERIFIYNRLKKKTSNRLGRIFSREKELVGCARENAASVAGVTWKEEGKKEKRKKRNWRLATPLPGDGVPAN